MKVLLVNPPFNRLTFGIGQLEPLGLEIIAASIQPKHRVSFIDLQFENRLQAKLREVCPDVVGVTAISVQASTAKQVLAQVKLFDPGVYTVVGGHHVTMLPEDFNRSDVDALVLGHGFVSFAALLDAWQRGENPENVPGLALVRESRLKYTPRHPRINIEEMPTPDRRITKRYRRHYDLFKEGRKALVVTSVGCPYRCTFCSCWKMTNGQYAVRSPESVVEEIASVEEGGVFFADDNTFEKVDRAFKMCELIKSRGIRKRYIGYARSDTIARHPELIEKWSEIGLERLIVGMEALTDEGLERVNKRSSIADNEKAVTVLKKHGVANIPHFLVRQDFGAKEFDAMLKYVQERDLWLPTFTVLTPLPGSELWKQEKQRLLTDSFDLFDLAHSVLPTKLPQEVFVSKLRQLYLRNYSPRRYARKRLWQLSQLLRAKLPEKETREIIPLLPLLVQNIWLRLGFRKIRRNHRLYLRPAGGSCPGGEMQAGK